MAFLQVIDFTQVNEGLHPVEVKSSAVKSLDGSTVTNRGRLYMKNVILLAVLMLVPAVSGADIFGNDFDGGWTNQPTIKEVMKGRVAGWKKLLNRVKIEHGIRLYYYPGEVIGNLRTSSSTRIGDGRAKLLGNSDGTVYVNFVLSF